MIKYFIFTLGFMTFEDFLQHCVSLGVKMLNFENKNYGRNY